MSLSGKSREETARVKLHMFRRSYEWNQAFGTRHGMSPSVLSLYHEFASVLLSVTWARAAVESVVDETGS